jgi:protein phosphatase
MNVAWKTDAGLVRNNNQDTVLVDREKGIFLLADGMGGHNAGDVASELAVKEAYAYILKEIARDVHVDDVSYLLEKALCQAHRAIKEKAESDNSLYGMGTTLVELYIRGDIAYVCHAGDSRAYLFRGTLHQVTRDHTVGDSYAARGDRESEKIPPQLWHVLTQALGTRDCPVPDKKAFQLKHGDIMLICSDGLTNMLGDDEIQGIITGHTGRLNEMVNVLTEAANKKGGKDNISVIAVEIEG